MPISVWLVTVCLAAVLVACGGSSDDGNSATPGQPAPVKDDQKVLGTGAPVYGGTYVVGLTSDSDTLDPQKSSSFNVNDRAGLIYSRLLRPAIQPNYKYGEAPLEPDLALSWDIAPDLLTYTFKLRPGVKWQNVAPLNGRPFVADDVVASFQRVQKQGYQAYMLTNVTSITAPDDLTVVLKLSAPFVPLLNFMGNHHMWILPREATDGRLDPNTSPVGTGPFILKKWERNVVTSYVRNPDYYETGKPYIDGIELKVLPDQGTRVAAFRAGETDQITAVTPQEGDALAAALPGAPRLALAGTTAVQLYVNMARKPFDDLKVRKALSMAIDRASLGKSLYGSGIYPGPVNPSLGTYALDQAELAKLQPFDIEGAKKLLAEAGFPTGFSTKMMITNGYGEPTLRQGQWVIEDLAKIGVKVELEVLDYATYFTQRWPKVDYDMGIGPQTPFQEPDEWLRSQLSSTGSRNWFNIKDPKLDEMLQRQTTIANPEERIKYIKDIQRYALTNLVNPMPTWVPDTDLLVNPRVQDYMPQPGYGFDELYRVWLKK